MLLVTEEKKPAACGLHLVPPINEVPAPPAAAQGFYLVYVDLPLDGPLIERHDSQSEAQAAAERISKEYKDLPIYVLQTLTVDRTYMECVTIREKTHFKHEEKEHGTSRTRAAHH